MSGDLLLSAHVGICPSENSELCGSPLRSMPSLLLVVLTLFPAFKNPVSDRPILETHYPLARRPAPQGAYSHSSRRTSCNRTRSRTGKGHDPEPGEVSPSPSFRTAIPGMIPVIGRASPLAARPA